MNIFCTKKASSESFFFVGPSFLRTYAWVNFVCVSWRTERLLCYQALSLFPGIKKKRPVAQGTGGGGAGGGSGGRIQSVRAHRPFPIRQTDTLKYSHTCISLCLAWGARTPTMLSRQLHKCLKWDTRQFLWKHIIANNLPCKVIINALLNM